MLTVNFFCWSYCQLLADSLEDQEVAKLKREFNYILAVIYGSTIPVGFRADVRQSSIINLRVGLDKVWEKFRHNTRNEIRRAEDNTRLSFVNLDPNVDRIYAAYSDFERRRNWIPVPRQEIKNSFIFSAYYDHKVIAGITCFAHGDSMRVGKIFSVRHSEREKVDRVVIGQATRKLVWEICKYAESLGYRFLDLGGVNFTDPIKVGISQFKQSFGGDVVPVYICRYGSKSFYLLRKLMRYFGKDIV